MSRRIHSVIVERISLLTGKNRPAVAHAESTFRIQKSAKNLQLSLKNRLQIVKIQQKLKEQQKTP